MNHFFPGRYNPNPLLECFNNRTEEEYKLPMDYLYPKVEELRSIVSIFRHGDRSPKLKLKIKTSDERFLEFFKGTHKDEMKYKDASNLTKFLNIAISIIAELEEKDPQLKDYLQMKIVLESRGHFDGLTRKLQLKVLERDSPEESPNKGSGKGRVKKVQIVLKWGGELSYTGYLDAIGLG
jgi:inositol hexakisphosphate/diphosphoinositol-pentakisphosphate kinase